MTKGRDVSPASELLEAYIRHFDDLSDKSDRREEFRYSPLGLDFALRVPYDPDQTGQQRAIGEGTTAARVKAAMVSLQIGLG